MPGIRFREVLVAHQRDAGRQDPEERKRAPGEEAEQGKNQQDTEGEVGLRGEVGSSAYSEARARVPSEKDDKAMERGGFQDPGLREDEMVVSHVLDDAKKYLEDIEINKNVSNKSKSKACKVEAIRRASSEAILHPQTIRGIRDVWGEVDHCS